MEAEIMEEFPLISSWSDHKYWTGFITSQTLLVRLAIQVPNFPSSQGVVLEGDEETLKILEPCGKQLGAVIDSNAPVLIFLREVRSIIEVHLKNNASLSTNPAGMGNGTEFYKAVFNELEDVGHENVEKASSNFEELWIRAFDKSSRKHVLRILIPQQYPKTSVKVTVELPCPQNLLNWPPKILQVYQKFKSEIEKYTKFWDKMDELDGQARVIDPIQPNKSDVYRRVLTDHNILVHLVFNPMCPGTFPEIKFSGSEKAVEELDILLDRDCKKWSDSKPIMENLEDILQCEFIPKLDPHGLDEEEVSEPTCVICYAFEFEGKIPETNCDCGSIYHEKCLGDLLVSDCSVKSMRLCVDCPVCGLEIKVSNAEKTSW